MATAIDYRAAVVAATMAIAAASSCGGNTVRSPIRTTTDLIAGLADVMCGWQFRCCTGPEMAALGHATNPTHADCVRTTKVALAERLAASTAAVAMQRASVDARLAAACLEGFEARACNPAITNLGFAAPGPWDVLARCLDPFVGKVATGETCFLSNECLPGSQCLPAGGPVDDGSGGVLPDGRRVALVFGGVKSVVGVCHKYRGEGVPCARTEECDPTGNLYCRRTDFRCATPALEGQACSNEFDFFSGLLRPVVACNAAAGLFCGNGVCRRPPANGEACRAADVSSEPCDPTAVPWLDCVGEEFNGTGTCKIPGLAGDACGGVGLPACDLALACLGPANTIGACGPAPGVGHACAIDFRCAPPAVCHLGQNTCLLPGDGPVGNGCFSDQDCASLFCGFSPTSNGPVCSTSPDIPVTCAGAGATPVTGANPFPTRADGGFAAADGTFAVDAAVAFDADPATDGGFAPDAGLRD